MPIYEFVCDSCGERYEALVELGIETCECRVCGSSSTHRVLSAQAPPMQLVRTPRETRQQERKNEALRSRTKDAFKASRRRAREARGKPPSE